MMAPFKKKTNFVILQKLEVDLRLNPHQLLDKEENYNKTELKRERERKKTH